MKDFKYMFDIAEAKTKLFDKETQPLSWGYQQGVFEALKEIKEWLIKHDAEIKKPLEDEIIELKEHIRALKSSHDLSHQAYLFAKNEGLDLQNQERQKVIAEVEEWANTIKYTLRQQDITTTETLDILKLEELKQKLKEMKGE